MAFWACDFIFDDSPSSLHNLYISSANGGGGFDQVVTPSDVEIITQDVYRRPKVYFYGTSPRPVLSFDVEFTSPTEIDSVRAQGIQRWLFGHSEYKKLQIIQNDMQSVYYNCFLTSPEVLKSGRVIIGYKATVVCDSPYAWEFEKTLTRTYTDPVISENYSFYNDSDDNGYMYPELVVTMSATGGDISIINNSDAGREFAITDLSPSEVLTIDNDLGIMSSSTGFNRLSLFNKKWFRFVPSINNLDISGNVASLVFTYSLARKVGT